MLAFEFNTQKPAPTRRCRQYEKDRAIQVWSVANEASGRLEPDIPLLLEVDVIRSAGKAIYQTKEAACSIFRNPWPGLVFPLYQ